LNRLGLERREIDLKKLWSLRKEKRVRHESILKFVEKKPG
jgi:hypothetical protein